MKPLFLSRLMLSAFPQAVVESVALSGAAAAGDQRREGRRQPCMPHAFNEPCSNIAKKF
jgi:hypothetical protein